MDGGAEGYCHQQPTLPVGGYAGDDDDGDDGVFASLAVSDDPNPSWQHNQSKIKTRHDITLTFEHYYNENMTLTSNVSLVFMRWQSELRGIPLLLTLALGLLGPFSAATWLFPE